MDPQHGSSYVYVLTLRGRRAEREHCLVRCILRDVVIDRVPESLTGSTAGSYVRNPHQEFVVVDWVLANLNEGRPARLRPLDDQQQGFTLESTAGILISDAAFLVPGPT